MNSRRIIPAVCSVAIAAAVVLLAACSEDSRSPLSPDAPESDSGLPEDQAGSPLSVLLAFEEKLTASDGSADDHFNTCLLYTSPSPRD